MCMHERADPGPALRPAATAQEPGVRYYSHPHSGSRHRRECGYFSVIQGVLLRPLPFHDPDHLFAVWAASPEDKSSKTGASGPDFQDYKEQSRSFENLAELIP